MARKKKTRESVKEEIVLAEEVEDLEIDDEDEPDIDTDEDSSGVEIEEKSTVIIKDTQANTKEISIQQGDGRISLGRTG